MVLVGISHHRPMISLPIDIHKKPMFRFPAGSSEIVCFYNCQLFKASSLKYY